MDSSISWLVFGNGNQSGTLRTTVKRIFDIILFLLLIVTLPYRVYWLRC
ncbi:MAG: hypothetical protein P0107_06980 [Nitrosomonas sp.]|nr:hypothetical protein [Nitrosomonas sp.]